jgi:hypothetical protein
MDLLGKMRESRAAKKADLDAILAKETPEDGDAARADALIVEIREADERIAAYKEMTEREAKAIENKVETGAEEPVVRGSAVVTREERMYDVENQKRGVSFVADVVSAQLRGDLDAAQRLQRHMAEERAEGVEVRDVGTGAFTGLTVPQYLTDLVAPPKRAMRPVADLARKLALPADGMTVNISRITTATATAVQASENAAVQETDADDTLLTVNVRTIAGQQDVSVQALQRSVGADAVIIADLQNAYHTVLDSQIINADGTSGSHLGIRSTSSIVSVTYTDASPTAAEAYPKLFDLISQIQSGVFGGATHLVMHPRRWNWFASQVGTSFPFLQPNNVSATNVGGEISSNTYGGVVGVLAGLPVVLDGNIVTNVGAGTNEDVILGVTADELFLWEQPGSPMLIRAEQTAAGNLTVKLVVYGFSAFTAGRYPGAHGTIGGTGLVTPVFA